MTIDAIVGIGLVDCCWVGGIGLFDYCWVGIGLVDCCEVVDIDQMSFGGPFDPFGIAQMSVDGPFDIAQMSFGGPLGIDCSGGHWDTHPQSMTMIDSDMMDH